MAHPAPTYTTPIPGVPVYGQAAALATQAYQNTLARLNQQRMRTLQSNGYTGSIDPQTGVLSGMHVDPFNQYGNLQTMLRSQAQEDTGAHYAAEQRGVHGGLAHQGISDLRYQHGSQSAQLGTSLADTLSGYQDQQTQAAYDRDMALWQAEQAAAQQAIANQDFNPAPDDPPPLSPPPSDTPAPRGSIGASVNQIKLLQQLVHRRGGNLRRYV